MYFRYTEKPTCNLFLTYFIRKIQKGSSILSRIAIIDADIVGKKKLPFILSMPRYEKERL